MLRIYTEEQKKIKRMEKEILCLRDENEFSKMALCFFHTGLSEIKAEKRFEYIKANVSKYSIALMCHVLKVTRSGYYKHLKKKKKSNKDAELLAEVKKILSEDIENHTYGKVRMWQALKQRGHICSRRRVSRVMAENELLQKKKRKPLSLTKSNINEHKSDNLLKRDFTADEPNKKWVTDITQIATKEGTLYISAIFDCFDNKMVGLSMGDNMRTELVVSTLREAMRHEKAAGVILHSDRGSQYTSLMFRETLDRFGVIQSMNSAGGKCHDNAKCESIWGRFKEEKLYKINTSKMTMYEVKYIIWRYFHNYWNNRRICSAIGGIAPTTKRRHYFDNIITGNFVA
jgi:transposase InsO family protein